MFTYKLVIIISLYTHTYINTLLVFMCRILCYWYGDSRVYVCVVLSLTDFVYSKQLFLHEAISLSETPKKHRVTTAARGNNKTKDTGDTPRKCNSVNVVAVGIHVCTYSHVSRHTHM